MNSHYLFIYISTLYKNIILWYKNNDISNSSIIYVFIYISTLFINIIW